MMRAYSFFLLMSSALAINLAWSQTNMLQVTDAWVRAAPPGAMALAGYMTIVNTSTEDVKVTAVESPKFARIEFHRTLVKNDIARMQKLDYFLVPANGELYLKPNGRHLMMMQPSSPLHPGDTVSLILQLDDGKKLNVDAKLR